MRSEVDLERKCVHLKIRRGVHAALRQELLKRGLSLQEVLDAFAEEVVRGKRSAVRVLDRVAAAKLRRQLGPLKPKRGIGLKGQEKGAVLAQTHDEESLYDIISEGIDPDDDAEDDEG